ncbi:hydrocephalus-inducing protein-like [Manacus candei]|uniref:hydrocephalus-inducing protein-like n=1 Tax=Manacus candei TaxID=415023 RepID=UPI0022272095|nr:hydrocephalus-inducing protein-like [Manacus candei]
MANLGDTGRFEDSMKLFIENSLTSVIPIQAVGIGTTIAIDKPFAPELNLEPQFNLVPCVFRFNVTNKGRQFQRLYWGTEGFSPFRQRHPLPALCVTKGKNASQRHTTPVFKLRPRSMNLQPGETMELVLEGFSSTVQDVEEKLVCETVVKPEITKKEIIKTKVTCKFISPAVQISSKAITFRVEKHPDDVLTLQYKPLSLKNTCCLPFHLLLDLEQPFLICDADHQPLPAGAQPVKMEAGQELHLSIGFNPAYEKDPISWVAEKTMKIQLVEHPHEEEITVRGEVYFPNLRIPTKALDFGCIANGAKQVRYLEMTNCSPIPAHYHWSFRVNSKEYLTGFIPSPPRFRPQPQMARFGCVECGRYSRRYFRPGSVREPAKAPEAAQDSSQQSSHSANCLETEQNSSQESSDSENSLETEWDSSEESSDSENSLETEWDSSEESSDSENSLETEWDSSEESSDSENSLETEWDSSEESSDSEGSLETEDDSPEQSPHPENSLETKQDSSQKSSHSEASPEAKVPPSTAAGPRSSVETKGSGQSAEAEAPGFRAEEVFGVQPVSGVLQPGKSQQVPFTFFGHANIIARVTALCRVEGGPTYEVELRGETSVLTYHLSIEEINCGLQLFNEVTRAEVTLRNDGKVGFTYVVQSPSTGTADKPLPGVLMVLPSTASIEPGKEQVLKLYYLPGVPGVFCRTFQVQVGHLKPVEISLKGEAIFAGICLDLPWSIRGSEKYERLLKQAKEKLKKDKQDKKVSVWRKARIRKRHAKGPGIVAKAWLRMEMEQMLIKENALELQPVLISRPPEDTVFDKSIPQKLVKVELPEYILDMGTVVQGYSKSCTVKITNTWRYPVAVQANERALRDTGFSIYLEPVEFLIYGTSKPFQVNFASANLPVGKVDVLLPIKVEKGPTLHICLRATVIQLLLSLSRNRLQFPDVQVGQCWCETVRLYNWFSAPCEWFLTVNKPAKKVDKRLTPAVRQKELQAAKDDSRVFQWKAREGTLYGREWCDLQIQFSPLEEKSYKTELKINVRGNSQLLVLHISGQGLEPSPTEISLFVILFLSPFLSFSHFFLSLSSSHLLLNKNPYDPGATVAGVVGVGCGQGAAGHVSERAASPGPHLGYGSIGVAPQDCGPPYAICVFASLLHQQENDRVGLLGFLPGEIPDIVSQAAQKRCFICDQSGATIPCWARHCDLSFHLPCAKQGACVTQFMAPYRPWELLWCSSCAAEGTHRACSGLRASITSWECDGCAGLGTASRDDSGLAGVSVARQSGLEPSDSSREPETISPNTGSLALPGLSPSSPALETVSPSPSAQLPSPGSSAPETSNLHTTQRPSALGTAPVQREHPEGETSPASQRDWLMQPVPGATGRDWVSLHYKF